MLKQIKIKSIKKLEGTFKVRDIEVENSSSYLLENGVISHNSGTKYAASITIFLSSSKDKEGEEVVGRIITCQLKKGRITKQDKKVKIALNFETGLNRYYGLLDIGARQGIFKHIDKQWKIGKQTAKESAIYDNPEKYFTPEVMQELEVAAGKEFLYGSSLTKVDE